MGIPILPTNFYVNSPTAGYPSPPTWGGIFSWDFEVGGLGGNTRQENINNLFAAVTKGQLPVFNGTNMILVSPASNGWILSANNTAPGGIAWVSPSAGGGVALHSSSHKHGGGDEVATSTPTANAIPKAGSAGTLGLGWIPTMIAASPSGAGTKGLVPSPSASSGTTFLKHTGTFVSPDHTVLKNKGTYTHTQLDSHLAASSAVHGLSGTVVGTSDTQTLTNKTIQIPYFLGSPGNTYRVFFGHGGEVTRFLGLQRVPNSGGSPINYLNIQSTARASDVALRAASYAGSASPATNVGITIHALGTGTVKVRHGSSVSAYDVVASDDARLMPYYGHWLPITNSPQYQPRYGNTGEAVYSTYYNCGFFWISGDTLWRGINSREFDYISVSPLHQDAHLCFPNGTQTSPLLGYYMPYPSVITEITAWRETIYSPVPVVKVYGSVSGLVLQSSFSSPSKMLGVYNLAGYLVAGEAISVKITGKLGKGGVTLSVNNTMSPINSMTVPIDEGITDVPPLLIP